MNSTRRHSKEITTASDALLRLFEEETRHLGSEEVSTVATLVINEMVLQTSRKRSTERDNRRTPPFAAREFVTAEVP